MNQLHFKRLPADETLLGKKVAEEPGLAEIRPDTMVFIDGVPSILYVKISSDQGLLNEIKMMKYSKHARVTQMVNEQEVNFSRDLSFGFRPANMIFNHAPGPSQINKDYPHCYKKLCASAIEIEGIYKTHFPEVYQRHKDQVETEIRPEYRISGRLFTQGVVNDKNMLGYHYDRDNLPQVRSAMVYFLKGVTGGNLILPEIHAKLIPETDTLVLFDGQDLMHGVTPIKQVHWSDYRYSIVFYTRDSMRGLQDFKTELTKMRQSELKKNLSRINK